MFLELFLGLVAAILFALLWWNGQIAKYKCLKQFPGPTPIPILGNVLEFRKTDEILQTIVRINDTYGPISLGWLANTPFLFITDRDMTEFFLRSPNYITKSDIYDILEPWLGTGMLASDGSIWQRKRKTVTPAFHFKVLDNYISIFDASCDTLVDVLSAKADERKCDLVPFITSFTLEIIAETAMGAKINTQREPKNEYVRAFHFMTALTVKRILSIWKKYDFLFQFTSDYKEQQRVCKILHDLTDKMIQERRQQLLQCREDEDIDMDGNRKKQTLFLDILLNATVNGEPLSDIEIRDEVTSFMFGGHDTTASALSLILYALSNNQDVQNKIVEELKVIFGNDKNRPSTIQDTYEMKYMECVIKEMLRYYTPVPLVARKLKEAVEYKGTILPKGLNLVFFMYGMHKNPEMFQNPNEFNPDRFISENTIKPYTFIPFSAGPRNCLGQKYAMYEIKVTIAKLLRHFEFLPAGPGSELKLSPDLVMKSLNGINVRIKPRDY